MHACTSILKWKLPTDRSRGYASLRAYGEFFWRTPRLMKGKDLRAEERHYASQYLIGARQGSRTTNIFPRVHNNTARILPRLRSRCNALSVSCIVRLSLVSDDRAGWNWSCGGKIRSRIKRTLTVRGVVTSFEFFKVYMYISLVNFTFLSFFFFFW